MAPPAGTALANEEKHPDWIIGDTLAQWWRPNFETFMYPFIPGHVTRPKECKKLYHIQLPKSSRCRGCIQLEDNADHIAEVLSVPKNMKLLSVPLFELYDNVGRYGSQLTAIPHLLSRYNFEYVDEDDNVVAVTPGGGPAAATDANVPITRVLAGEGANGAA